VVEVETPEQLQAEMGPQTAMIYILSSPAPPAARSASLTSARPPKPRNIPVFVDAAAEDLTIPNIHLAAGATLVGYSGGKCMRGPQCAGLLLGQRNWSRQPGSRLRRTTMWDAP
jgi:seryl-tRNA(Sec) selenium transferase